MHSTTHFFNNSVVSEQQIQNQFDSISKRIRSRISGLNTETLREEVGFTIRKYEQSVLRGDKPLKIQTAPKTWKETDPKRITPLLEEYKDIIEPALDILDVLRVRGSGLRHLSEKQMLCLLSTDRSAPLVALHSGRLGATNIDLPLSNINGHSKVWNFSKAIHAGELKQIVFNRFGTLRFPFLYGHTIPKTGVDLLPAAILAKLDR